MRFPRYPEYKESGFELLGSIPGGWSIFAMKRFAQLAYGDALPTEARDGDGQIPVYGSNGIVGFHSSANTKSPAILIGRKGSYGALNWSTQSAFAIDTVYYIDKANCLENLRWLFWALHIADFSGYSQDTGVPGLSRTLAHNTHLPLPTHEEQTAIATFLDHETAKIDALVAEQEKLIDLLKEKRQAVISHAVTKGLDPNVPMKDSGVEWLGKVPEHWHVCPLKYLVSFSSGGTPSKDNLNYWEGDIPWASAKDLKTEKLNDTVDHITQLAVDTGVATLLPANSILVVVRGMILARTFPVTQTTVPMAINQDLKGIWPTDGLTPDFLAWLLRGSADESLLRLDEAGHGTKALRMDAWTSMRLPVPPKGEQVEIVKVLDAETAKLDNLVSEATKAIDLLKERRTALISAAVTGKIDVRAFHPELTEAA